MQRELKIVIGGPMGAGKTALIRALSDVPVVATEAYNTRRDEADKATTTVAMDYGRMELEDGVVVSLFGTPGQDRFSYMWEILAKGALGVVVLVDANREDAEQALRRYVGIYEEQLKGGAMVVGLTKLDLASPNRFDELATVIAEHYVTIPVIAADPRTREGSEQLMELLLMTLEMAAEQDDMGDSPAPGGPPLAFEVGPSV
ncbi:MAG: ATP/GTP-binding protein [Pseudomonadota bacterium]